MKRALTKELLLSSLRCPMVQRRVGRLLLAAALAAPWLLKGLPSSQAQGSKPSEYAVKAAYLYNFGNYVEWPAKITDSMGNFFNICVLGQDPFGPALDATLTGETVGGKRVVAKRLSKPQDATSCRVVYISLSEESQLKEIVSSLDKMSVLTVSDMPEFAQRGGMVQFVLEQNKVRFEINLSSTDRAGLTLSSELLKLAIRVKRNAQPGE